MLAPINKIPSEVLTLIPGFLESITDQEVISLTHVCQAWREMFISRSSLWTHLDCKNADKTRVYLERLKSSRIDLCVRRDRRLLPNDPFFEVGPRHIRRFKSLGIWGTPEGVQDMILQLSHPAPLLKLLTIGVRSITQLRRAPAVTPAFFDGDLSSLRELCLLCVRTELPWRNMVNLTSFALGYTPPGQTSTRQLLDFLESAPHLRKLELHLVPLMDSDQNGRLISLAYLKRLCIYTNQPSSPLFDHLLIPVGVYSSTELESLPRPRIEDHLPGSLANFGNLSSSTQLRLCLKQGHSDVQFTGPNGKVQMVSMLCQADTTSLVFESLARFDTSTIKWLKIIHSEPLSEDLPYLAPLPMQNLHTLTISRCKNPYPFIRALGPDTTSSNTPIFPKLGELVLRIDEGVGLDIESVVGMVAARASSGIKLKSVRIVSPGEIVPADMSELKKHVLHVEHVSEDGGEED